MRSKIIAVALLVLLGLVGSGCGSNPGFHARVDSAVEPYDFSVAEWQYQTITQQITQAIEERDEEKYEGDADDVRAYFSLVGGLKNATSRFRASVKGSVDVAMYAAEMSRLQEVKDALTGTAEMVIEQQIKETLADHGIYHPLRKYLGLDVNFPPPNFKLVQLPYLLVISPRERIQTVRTNLLRQDMTVAEMEEVEAAVGDLVVSSLVVELGGLGATYPTLVTNDADIHFVLDTATHEWVHQYLVFRPLGFRYLLDLAGIAPSYEIATMNETVADIVAGEISAIVVDKYYTDFTDDSPSVNATEPGINFDREMREIRKAVDQYLARGEVEVAERFMEERRQYLEDNGYYIRKLNQAYFAFHGKYADRPAFISPIGLELKELRAESASLKDFLDTAASVSSRQDLQRALEKASR